MNKPRNLPTTRPMYLFVTILYNPHVYQTAADLYAPIYFGLGPINTPPTAFQYLPPILSLSTGPPAWLFAPWEQPASLRICHASALNQFRFLLAACPEQLEIRQDIVRLCESKPPRSAPIDTVLESEI